MADNNNGNFLQSASARMERKGTKGLFKRQAERHGMSTQQWAQKQKGSPSPVQRKRATFALNAMRAGR
jgi:hypothetical protein